MTMTPEAVRTDDAQGLGSPLYDERQRSLLPFAIEDAVGKMIYEPFVPRIFRLYRTREIVSKVC